MNSNRYSYKARNERLRREGYKLLSAEVYLKENGKT